MEMKAQQKATQIKTGPASKYGHITFGAMSGLIKFRRQTANQVDPQSLLSIVTAGPTRIEEQAIYNLEAERRASSTRTYSNMIPPR
jgi:hypothetical protein